MTIACKQNNAPTDMLHCTSNLSNLCKFHSIECLSLALLILCFAGPWIQTKSRLGTQAWPFLSSEAPLIQQVLPLKTLRYQQQTPHNPRPTKTSPKRSRRHARQANGRTKPRNAGSIEDRLQPTRAAHLAAHLVSPPTSIKTTTFNFNSSIPASQHTKHRRRQHRHELARGPDPEHALRCWSELDTVAHVIF